MHPGYYLEQHLKNHNLTVEKLSEITGYGKAYIRQVCNGWKQPGLTFLRSVAWTTYTPLPQLLGSLYPTPGSHAADAPGHKYPAEPLWQRVWA